MAPMILIAVLYVNMKQKVFPFSNKKHMEFGWAYIFPLKSPI